MKKTSSKKNLVSYQSIYPNLQNMNNISLVEVGNKIAAISARIFQIYRKLELVRKKKSLSKSMNAYRNITNTTFICLVEDKEKKAIFFSEKRRGLPSALTIYRTRVFLAGSEIQLDTLEFSRGRPRSRKSHNLRLWYKLFLSTTQLN